MGIESDEMDIYTIHHVTDKLDTESRRQWEIAHPGTDLFTYSQLSEFLTTRCRALESALSNRTIPPHQGITFGQATSRQQVQPIRRNQSYATTWKTGSKCPKCSNEDHGLYACSSFKELDVDRRRNFVQGAKLCFNCMRSGHISKDCPSQKKCRTCGKSHNTLLHVDKPPLTAFTYHKEVSTVEQNPQVTITTNNEQVLLQTAIVNVLDKQGMSFKCRALLDSGSQINLITNSCRSRLGLNLERSNSQFTVAGTAQMSSMGKSTIVLQVNDLLMKTSATVVQGKLTLPLPAVKFEKPVDVPKVKLADPNFNQPAEIDMIIGAQLYESLRNGKTI